MHAKSLQLCLTLCAPMDHRLPGSSVHGTFQARILKCVAMPLLGDLPNPVIKPVSLMSLALTGRFLTTSTTWGAQFSHSGHNYLINLKTPCLLKI